MSLVLSEPHPDVDKVILSVRELQNIRAEYERLRSINAELLETLDVLEYEASSALGFGDGRPLSFGVMDRPIGKAIHAARRALFAAKKQS